MVSYVQGASMVTGVPLAVPPVAGRSVSNGGGTSAPTPTPTLTPTPIPSPAIGTYALPSNVQGGEAGRGFTCTGLARDPLDGTWWVGNDGRSRGGSTPAGTVVHLSADFSTVLAEYPAAQFGIAAGTSCQGVAMIGDRVGALFKRPGTGSTNLDTAVIFERDGTLFNKNTTTSTTSDYNGLAYDTLREQVISATASGISWRNVSDFIAVSPTKAYSITGIDQITYVAENDTVLTTGGTNGTDGTVVRYRATDFVEIARTTVAGATAIEGIVEFDGKWAVANDGWFHNGGAEQNVVIVCARPI